jgi:hypothetical protein
MERAITYQAPVRPEFLRRRVVLRRVLVLLFAACLSVVVVAYAGIAAARAAGYGVVIALDSAGDAVPAGELLIGRAIPVSEVRPGQVVVVQQGRGRGSEIAIRRVASLHEEYGEIVVRTTDPASGASDPNLYALADHVVAPSHSLPYVGFAAGAFTSPLGWLLCLGLPASVLSFLALRRLWLPSRA